MNALTQTFVVIGLFCALGGQTLTAQTGSTVIATGHPVDENISSSFAAIARRALTGNFDLQSRRTAYEAQVSTIRAVNAGLRPRVDLDMLGGADRSRQVDNTGNSERFSGSSSRATLSLRQPLYDGNAISSEAERQARLGNVQYFELRQAEDALMVDLTRAWIDATRQRALIQIAQANLVAHERLVGLVQTRVQSGISRGVDLDQATTRLASARLALASDQGLLADALARFRRAATVVAPTQLAPFSIQASMLPANERDAIANAVVSAPTLRISAERAAAVDAELRGRRAAYAPRIALEGRHDLNARTAFLRDATSSSLLLTFNYNLYAGGGDEARIQDAALRYQAARQQFQDGVNGLVESVSATWAEAQRQLGINVNAQAYAESVVKTRDVYRVQYEIGQRSLLDLLNTENEVAQAQRLKLNSAADLSQAQIRLLVLAGRLSSGFAIERNNVQPLIAPAPDPVDAPALIASGARDAGLSNSGNIAAAPARLESIESTPVATLSPVPTRPTRPTLVPSFDPRLPMALTQALQSWRDAISAGLVPETLEFYSNGDAAAVSALWITSAPPVAQRGRRFDIVAADRIDSADQGASRSVSATGNVVQVSVLAIHDESGVVRCVRSAQIWRLRSRAPQSPQWRIERERALRIDDRQCPRSRD